MPKTGIPVHIKLKTGTYLNQVKNARHERCFWAMRKRYKLFLGGGVEQRYSSIYAASKSWMGLKFLSFCMVHAYICECFGSFRGHTIQLYKVLLCIVGIYDVYEQD